MGYAFNQYRNTVDNWKGGALMYLVHFRKVREMSVQEKSEDVVGKKVDRCISDVLIKTGILV